MTKRTSNYELILSLSKKANRSGLYKNRREKAKKQLSLTQ